MNNPFDQVIDRKNTHSIKWDGLPELFGEDDLIPMWVADMDFKAPKEVVQAVTQRATHGIYGYEGDYQGYVQAFSSWLEKQFAWSVDGELIRHSPGVVLGLVISIRALTEPGERIVIQPPVYTPFFKVVSDNDRVIVENPLILEDGHFTMNFKELEEIFKSGVKTMILCSPHNPVGRVWTKEELNNLARLVTQYEVTLLADEIWSDLIFKGHQHTPIASLSPEIAQRTLTFMGPSKTFNVAGFYLANIIIPNETFRRRFTAQIKALSLEQLNLFGIVAGEAAYKHGEEWLNNLMNYLEGNVEYVIARLATVAPQIKVFRPEGTYVLWLDCRSLGIPYDQLNQFFVKNAGLALTDGQIFGSGGQGFQRMNIGCPRALIEEALEGIEKALKTLDS
ncbi:MAG: MalY/PatB family protein [Bacillota bacterium]|nr:MalY/PatB family protein [Bacillota bacterium]HHU61203.1 pyridoxal phosphate-dependent aminotransferase [Natronincola sp.]